MIGILIILVISWALLYLVERKSILVLGIIPVRRRLKQFGIGFLLTSLLCISVQFLEITLESSQWLINKEIEANLILRMLFWDLKSVITEELIFRGALLYIGIQKLGKLKGILIASIAFGIYHWFSFGILGNIIPMIVVFIGTGLMGYTFALSFSKTKSIAMPIGLHLGWNFTFNTIFSKGPLGNGILLSESNNIISDWFSLIGLWVVPIIVLLFIKIVVPQSN
jgi:CAAX protease family protein